MAKLRPPLHALAALAYRIQEVDQQVAASLKRVAVSRELLQRTSASHGSAVDPDPVRRNDPKASG